MYISMTEAGIVDEAASNRMINVVVSLTAKDHEDATLAARASNETLTEWISSLVHIAIQP
jgi:hypothetical protein